MTRFLLVGVALYVAFVLTAVGGLMCAKPEPADDAADAPTVPLQKRRPLPMPSFEAFADDEDTAREYAADRCEDIALTATWIEFMTDEQFNAAVVRHLDTFPR